jgi:hypothetical protein
MMKSDAVIARHEAICASLLSHPDTRETDCFVPRNDGEMT